MSRILRLALVGSCALWSLAGCSSSGGGGPDDVKDVDLHGAVLKGPFVVGSTIAVSQLDGDLSPTGQVFNAQTKNDRGEFDISFEAAGAVALEGVGYYYNEVTGALSASNLTLRAFYVPAGSGEQAAYVNMITHLTTSRIRALVQAGQPFAAAVGQAEGELLAALQITEPDYATQGSGIGLNVLGGDTDDNAYLLGVSAVLIQVALARGGSVEANLQELLNTFANDFADGALEASLAAELGPALLALDVDRVARQFAARLTVIGSDAAVPDMHRVLDQDRDGIANLNDNCPKAANPLQEDGDEDGHGDACDACPATPCADACVPAGPSQDPAADTCYTACAADAYCATGKACVQTPIGGAQACGAPCDPFAPACAAGEGCFLLDATDPGGTGTRAFACLPGGLHGDRGLGEPCAYDGTGPQLSPDFACAAGTLCGQGNDFAFTACRALCDPQGPDTCGGPPCVGVDLGEGGPQLGLCELPPGELGEACGQWPDTCVAGLRCAFSVEACGARPDPTCCVEAGGESQPCLPDNGCDAGLVCYLDAMPGMPGSGLCPEGDPGQEVRCCVPAGDELEPCYADQSCNPGFACIYDWQRCTLNPDNPAADGACCVPGGGEGLPCYADQTCDADLECIQIPPHICGSDLCCFSTGGTGEPCGQHQSCDAGLQCRPDDSCLLEEPPECCLPDPALCGNTTCDPGETVASCPQDCADCGDTLCSVAVEDGDSCPLDCPQVCNDGNCYPPEDFFTCPQDCPEVCGDGACTPSEDEANCWQDCDCMNNPALCDDGDPCTSDHCMGGACEHNPNPGCSGCTTDGECADADPCTLDTCAGGLCRHDPDPACSGCTSSAQCDDGDACTLDTCVAGACQHAPDPGCGGCTDDGQCDDGNTCTIDTCSGGICRHDPDPGCGGCTGDLQCDDGNPCTSDTCAAGTCQNNPLPNGSSCDDGQFCNGTATCDGGANCMPQPLDCDDGNLCTADGCDEAGDSCTHTQIPGCCTVPAQCSDGNACTQDDCQAGACTHNPLPDGMSCDDGQYCNGGAACLAGGCQPQPLNCDDGDLCTLDGCDEAVDNCTHTLQPNPGAEGPAGDPTCTDGADNDCDTLSDGADPDCAP